MTRLWRWSLPSGIVQGLAISVASTVVHLRGLLIIVVLLGLFFPRPAKTFLVIAVGLIDDARQLIMPGEEVDDGF